MPSTDSHTQLCFLSPLDHHDRLTSHLDRTILLHFLNSAQTLDRFQLVAILLARYGGTTSDWKIQQVYQGFLITLPNWLHHDELYLDGSFWERRRLVVEPWQTLDDSQPLPPLQRVRIIITGFPIDFWYPVYIRQATAAMGTVFAIHGDCLLGDDRTAMRLWIDSSDLSLIPSTLRVGHHGRTTDCRVLLEGRDDLSSVPLPPLPPPDSDAGESLSVDPQAQLQQEGGIYVPPWRRRILRFPQPTGDRSREGAPAAISSEFSDARSTFLSPDPGPGGFPLLSGTAKLQRGLTQSDLYQRIGKRQSHLLRECNYPTAHKAGNRAKCPYKTGREDTRTIVGDPNLEITSPIHRVDYSPKRINSGTFPLHTKAPSATCQLNTPPPLKSNIAACTRPLLVSVKQKKFPNLSQTKGLYNPFSSRTLAPIPCSHSPCLLNPPSTKYKTHTCLSFPVIREMADFTKEDEELIAKFIGLHTEEKNGKALSMPAASTSLVDWSLCLLARVVSDKTALEDPFQRAMRNAWSADPDTIFSTVAKNCFLIQFPTPEGLANAISKGPWTFRGDLVALNRVSSQLDLAPVHVRFSALWVQLFNVPPYAFTEEGLVSVGREIGKPLSRPFEGYVGGKRFFKIKVEVDLLKPLKDKVKVTHPELGEVLMHCVYEKVMRICTFCGHLGHEISTCSDYERLTVLMQSPAAQAKAAGHSILSPTKGLWMTNATLVPKPDENRPNSGLKRQHHQNSTLGPQPTGDQFPQAQSMGNPDLELSFLEDGSDPGDLSHLSKPKRPRPAGPNPLAAFL